MEYTYDDDRLTITADAEDLAELAELKTDDPDGFGNDRMMVEFFEDLLANSELDWIDAADMGDLTDAPMLGIRGDEQDHKSGPFGVTHCGHWDEKDWYQPITHRWGFMDYQVRSLLDDLLDRGEAVLVSAA